MTALSRGGERVPAPAAPVTLTQDILIRLTGLAGTRASDRKSLGKEVEARLFEDGHVVYFLGIGNVLYGVDADIARKSENRQEHLRRLAEVANLMLDSGVILIVTAADLTQEDLEVIKTSVDPDRIETVWVGDSVTTDITVRPALLAEPEAEEEAVERIKASLAGQGRPVPPLVTW